VRLLKLSDWQSFNKALQEGFLFWQSAGSEALLDRRGRYPCSPNEYPQFSRSKLVIFYFNESAHIIEIMVARDGVEPPPSAFSDWR